MSEAGKTRREVKCEGNAEAKKKWGEREERRRETRKRREKTVARSHTLVESEKERRQEHRGELGKEALENKGERSLDALRSAGGG